MNTESHIVAFQAISSFINDLSGVFGEDQRSIKLYAHLISKTTNAHEIAISKHIQLFRDFCVQNRESIESKDINLKSTRIEYSEKVVIDMADIFKRADTSTSRIIWRHLLIISAIVDVTGQALKILKETPSDESDFLTDIIDKIESTIKPDADPMSTISSLMSSGVLNELIQGVGSGMTDGSLDINKLIGGVQKIISKTSGGTGGEEAAKLNGIMDMIKQGGDEGGEAPDISKMLGPLMGMLSQQQGGDEGDETPDISKMLGTLSQQGDEAPDLSKLLGMFSQQGGEGGEAPDISKMLGPLMGMMSPKGGGVEAPDISGLMASLTPPDGKVTKEQEVLSSTGGDPETAIMLANLMFPGK
jgi:hypothetical protein